MDKWFPIQTERLLLREFTTADGPDVHEYAADRVVTRLVPWGPNTPTDTHAVMRGRLEEQRHWPRDEVTLAVELRSEKKLIGAIGSG